MKNKYIIFGIIFAAISVCVHAMTQGEIDDNRAEAIFNKKNAKIVLTAEETKWYADYIKKCVAMCEKEKIVAPQLVSVASNVASKVLPFGCAVRKVEANLCAAGPATDKYRITLKYKNSSGFYGKRNQKSHFNQLCKDNERIGICPRTERSRSV